MEKLNQIVAIEKGVRARTQKSVTALHHLTKKGALFNGHVRKYEPLNDEGERFDDDQQLVQMRVAEVLRDAQTAWTEQIDIVASKDFGNVQPAARADVIVDGEILIHEAPVPFLLYLEKELTDVQTFINALPELDPALSWSFDENQEIYRSEATRTVKTMKFEEPVVLLEPTKEHPGKAEMVTKDRTIGHWNLVKLSGCLPLKQKQQLVDKIHRLIDAVKQARERANTADIERQKVGAAIFKWLLD
jgi:hypothetical protein